MTTQGPTLVPTPSPAPAVPAAPSALANIFDQKTVVALVALGVMLALAGLKEVDGNTVADFVKWLATAYVGGAAVTAAAQKIGLGNAASAIGIGPGTTVESRSAHTEIITALKRR